MENNANKTIITVVGKDTVGIIAKVWCQCFRYFPDHCIRILQYDDDRGYDKSCKKLCRLSERSGCIRRRDRRFNQMPEGRNLRYDAQNLGGKR